MSLTPAEPGVDQATHFVTRRRAPQPTPIDDQGVGESRGSECLKLSSILTLLILSHLISNDSDPFDSTASWLPDYFSTMSFKASLTLGSSDLPNALTARRRIW